MYRVPCVCDYVAAVAGVHHGGALDVAVCKPVNTVALAVAE